jgi:AraC family transcriptional regulator
MAFALDLAVSTYQNGARQRAHSHDELHFSLVLSGRVSEDVGRSTEYGSPLSVVAKDSGVVHANSFDPLGCRMARISLKGGTMAALLDDMKRGQPWRWTHDARVARPFLRLVRRATLGARTIRSDDGDLIDLLAAFTARRVESNQGAPPVWLSDTVEALRAEWSPGTTVAHIAQRAGVHPVYLARCARRWYGHGIAEEMRRVRIKVASAAIATEGATISSIAHTMGFADEPHLCREFARTTGVAPGRYRQLLRSLRHIGCADSRPESRGP